ncbi:MAG: chemotaxis protein CheW [Solirubrobacteraceae bacterium]
MSQDSSARQLVVFTLCGEQYALPIAHVQEIIRYTQPRPVASSDCWVRGVLNLRGKIVPDVGSFVFPRHRLIFGYACFPEI